MIRTAPHLAFVILGILVSAAIPVPAETAKPSRDLNDASRAAPKELGAIFNLGLNPMDLQAYQAGFGVKLGWEELCVRGLIDLVASSASGSFGLRIGGTAEYHLTPEPISFYVGGLAGGEFMTQSGSFTSFVISVGAVAGVEYFPVKFLSVFMEYALAGDFIWMIDQATSQTTFDFLVDTKMGNDSKIGVVIYFLRLKDKKK